MNKIKKENLTINSELFDFINKEVIPGTGINVDKFWKKFDFAVHELTPINKALIEKRETIQKKIDTWHLANKDKNYKPMDGNFEKSIAFLTACDLVFKGRIQPSGYTDPLLHKRKLEKKELKIHKSFNSIKNILNA